MNYNLDQDTRNSMLTLRYPEFYKKTDPYFPFGDLNVKTLEKLIELGFVDLKERQNDSPTIASFLKFMQEHLEYRAIGYAINKPREDYRITIEGLEGCPADEFSRMDFAKRFRNADEFTNTEKYVRAWYD